MDSGSPSPTVKTPPDGSKMRLFHRDDTCVVCYAAGDDIIHRWYTDETSCFRGSHIFPLRYFELWDILQLGSRMKDPFTKPGNKKQDGTIVEDSRRMDSTDNGLILCGNHHILWNMMMFCIHPDTHCIAAFQPIAKNLHGLKITRPWENPRAKYPPPNRDILYRHFFSCIVKWMKGDRKDAEVKEADYDEVDPWDDVWDESRLPPRPVMEDYLAIRLAES
ncbi:hypothetical protein BD410DRAFT_515844 [Rickenella mellea]|uniref:HNH nuclease domain-containing protein n=1 Tax=Rickenella mellea TaxID=50990 RepID=A0A4Y7PRY8_9AGAM|nr:hypothetical protein BD410DRAFT_515844 [Rickenella mellea]